MKENWAWCSCIFLSILIFCSFVWSTWPGLWMCWHSRVAENENETSMPVFSPDTLCECLSRAGESLNEPPLESPEGEFSSARPGDLTCWQMIAALFSLTPPFEKSSGFTRKCPHCFDTVAWIPSPPGLAYGHSMLLFMWDICSAKTGFSSIYRSLHSASLFVSVNIFA